MALPKECKQWASKAMIVDGRPTTETRDSAFMVECESLVGEACTMYVSNHSHLYPLEEAFASSLVLSPCAAEMMTNPKTGQILYPLMTQGDHHNDPPKYMPQPGDEMKTKVSIVEKAANWIDGKTSNAVIAPTTSEDGKKKPACRRGILSG